MVKTLKFAAAVSTVQGISYVLPGVWALVAMKSYQSVHQLNSDYWLVKSHGMFLVLIGSLLVLAGLRRSPALEAKLLGLGVAVGLALTSTLSALTVGLAPPYRVDLVAELAFASLWLGIFRSGAKSN